MNAKIRYNINTNSAKFCEKVEIDDLTDKIRYKRILSVNKPIILIANYF